MKSFNTPSKISGSRANAGSQRVSDPLKTIVDNRPTAIMQRKLQESVNQSHHQTLQLKKTQVIQRMYNSLPDMPKELLEQVVGYANDSQDRANMRLVNRSLAKQIPSINKLSGEADSMFDRGLSTGEVRDWLLSKGVPDKDTIIWAWNLVRARQLPNANGAMVNIFAFRIPPRVGDTNYIDPNDPAPVAVVAPVVPPAPVAVAPAVQPAPANTSCCGCTIL